MYVWPVGVVQFVVVRSGAFGLLPAIGFRSVIFSAASFEVAGGGGSYGDWDEVVDVAAESGHMADVGVAHAVAGRRVRRSAGRR